ncbi:MAG: glycosyltransferase family 2 protein [Candidatus Zixiibacteriota bacterium]|nr:MAG: glycosyltransferase family 2 protein [candidate division Zixibacteria bacterium]
MEEYPKISVVVPIRNEGSYITSTLRFLLEQDYPPDKLEVLVVDGESDDRGPAVVRELAAEDNRIRLLSNPKRLSSAGRNIGARNASGRIVIFVDGHTYIDNDQLLKNTVRLMDKHHLSVLSRPQFLETPENTFFQNAVALARRSIIGHGPDSTIYTNQEKAVDPTSSGASYRREVFDRVGFFDERFDACEDVEFNYRLSRSGLQSFTSLKTAVYYYPRASISALFRQLKRYGIGRFRLACKHPQTLSFSTLIPFFFTAGIPILAILSLFFRPVAYLFFAVIALYLLLVFLLSAVIAVRRGLVYLTVLPAIFPVIHIGLGWGFLTELVRTAVGRGMVFEKPENTT